MIHDFQITENYVIFPDLPLEANPKNAIKKQQFIFHFDEKKPCRYGIMPRYDNHPNNIQWFDVPAHYCFHYVNSWEEKNSKGETIITMFAVVWNRLRINLQEAEHFWDATDTHYLQKYTFNLSSGKCDIKVMLTDLQFEFPIVNQEFMWYKNRYAYLAFADPEAAKLEVNDDDLFLQGFIKYDLIEEKVVAKVHFGPTKSGGEVFYQQRDNTDPLTDEDNGYLMTAVFDA